MVAQEWIVVADQRRARLLTLQKTPGGHWRADEHEVLESRWEDYHEHGRPSSLGGRSSSVHAHFSPGGSEVELQEERKRFARDVLRWLDAGAGVPTGQRVTMFAAPGLFGALRDEMGGPRHGLDLHEIELASLRPHEIAEHRAVRLALGIEKPARAADE